tara:strand:- start:254 stop:505 length:252 start_codon:yes stop_codon:yes gene_type:complete
MSYISFDSDDIQKGADAMRLLSGMEDVIYDMCEYDYSEAKVKLREGYTLEDLVNGLAVAILGDADKWQSLEYARQRAENKEEA